MPLMDGDNVSRVRKPVSRNVRFMHAFGAFKLLGCVMVMIMS